MTVFYGLNPISRVITSACESHGVLQAFPQWLEGDRLAYFVSGNATRHSSLILLSHAGTARYEKIRTWVHESDVCQTHLVDSFQQPRKVTDRVVMADGHVMGVEGGESNADAVGPNFRSHSLEHFQGNTRAIFDWAGIVVVASVVDVAVYELLEEIAVRPLLLGG